MEYLHIRQPIEIPLSYQSGHTPKLAPSSVGGGGVARNFAGFGLPELEHGRASVPPARFEAAQPNLGITRCRLHRCSTKYNRCETGSNPTSAGPALPSDCGPDIVRHPRSTLKRISPELPPQTCPRFMISTPPVEAECCSKTGVTRKLWISCSPRVSASYPQLECCVWVAKPEFHLSVVSLLTNMCDHL